MFQDMLGNYKTTIVAFLLAGEAVLHSAAAMLDADPSTNPDWAVVVTLLIAAVGMLFAKDADQI